MKISLILLAALFVCQYSYSQELTGSEPTQTSPSSKAKSIEGAHPVERPLSTSTVQKGKSVTISKRAGQAQVTHDFSYYEAEIAKIDAQVDAIDSKIAYVNADLQRKSEAQASGWFDDMNRIKEELALTRKSLVEKRDSL